MPDPVRFVAARGGYEVPVHGYRSDTVHDPVRTDDTMARSTMRSLWWD
ncbi:hypothetical protein ACWEP8_28255 [Streptomyces hydrogenans]